MTNKRLLSEKIKIPWQGMVLALLLFVATTGTCITALSDERLTTPQGPLPIQGFFVFIWIVSVLFAWGIMTKKNWAVFFTILGNLFIFVFFLITESVLEIYPILFYTAFSIYCGVLCLFHPAYKPFKKS